MDAQLGEIKMLLQAQAEDKAVKEGKAAKTDVGDEEAIYVAIQKAAGLQHKPQTSHSHVLAPYLLDNVYLHQTPQTHGLPVGITTDVPFKRFVLAFESFFLGGEDMAPKVSQWPESNPVATCTHTTTCPRI